MATSSIKIYNTLSRRKETIKLLHKKKVNLFVCGPTVYDFSHIGHARTCIVFDFFAKYLKKLGFEVFYLQNITNIDDKIIIRARERGVLPEDLAETFFKEYLKDMKLIGVDSVKKYAKATDYIKAIISQVERLLEKGYAYLLPDDGIYFDISKFKNYGKLSGRSALQAEDAVSRIDYSKNKRNRGDFCLWKFSSVKEPKWDAPFGKGRPGWHIEDTAITEKFFGPQYDIHGAAQDLIFPHHEAEIAQMEALSGKKPLARYWMHIGFLTIQGQKMSKSLGNTITIDTFLKRHSYRFLRFWVAKNLWRAPIDYSESSIIEVKSNMEKIEEFLRKIKNVKKIKPENKKLNLALKKVREQFYKSLNDDFNTPKAFGILFEFIKEGNKFLDKGEASKKNATQIYEFFKEINVIFNIIDFNNLARSPIPNEVKKLVQEREAQRDLKNWQKADEIRNEIEKYGFLVEDTKEGVMVKRK